MALKTNCIVTNAPEESGAWAVREDNNEMVYIPHKMADALDIEEFDILTAIIVPQEHETTPWLAIRARRASQS